MSLAYDPLMPPLEEDNLPLDLIPAVAKRTARQFTIENFRAVYDRAVNKGLVSEQEIDRNFGTDTLRKLQSDSTDPNPAQCRQILHFISKKDPKDAEGNKLPWRHASPRPKEERTFQPL